MNYEQPLRVGKVQRYEFGLTNWLNGEALQSALVVPNAKATLVMPADIDGDVIGFFLEGVATGGCILHVEYTTATRSDCQTLIVNVLNC